MAWEIEVTDEFKAWFGDLDLEEQEDVAIAVELVGREGPTLGRPFVDTIKRSRHPNLKELRPLSGNIRVLFAFDPRRFAILLLGGDKTGQWAAWYARMIPLADDLYDAHLDALRREGLLP